MEVLLEEKKVNLDSMQLDIKNVNATILQSSPSSKAKCVLQAFDALKGSAKEELAKSSLPLPTSYQRAEEHLSNMLAALVLDTTWGLHCEEMLKPSRTAEENKLRFRKVEKEVISQQLDLRPCLI